MTEPTRFAPEVAEVLTGAGWQPGRSAERQTEDAVRMLERMTGRRGARHRSFPAAVDVLTEFGGLHVMQDGPGEDVRRRPFAIDPTRAAATTETLADLGRLLGVRLFPIGFEGDDDALLAVDERGRVFALDHAGEWYLGGSIDEALTALVSGTMPARVRDDGTW
jgi:hypothetical protein